VAALRFSHDIVTNKEREAMNADTQRYVDSIKKEGWYPEGQTLGAGGWQEVNKFASDWKIYLLQFAESDEEPRKILAKDDATAKIAFENLYDLVKWGAYSIVEKITTYRTICSNNFFPLES